MVLVIAFLVVVELVGFEALQIAGTDQIAIIDAPREYPSSELSRDLGRSFESTTSCVVTRPGATIHEILGPNARAILVHHYKKPAWPDMAVVTEYLHRILAGLPEGGGLSNHVHWAELKLVEISGSIEFRDGRRSRIEFANGYAHVEDESGCQWWGRYLGEDRSRWIVGQ